jgi:hypothetical protein
MANGEDRGSAGSPMDVPAVVAMELVKITMQHVNAQLAAGCCMIDVDAVHKDTLRQYREAWSAVEERRVFVMAVGAV